MSRQTSKKSPNDAQAYPRISVRVQKNIMSRLDNLRAATGLSYGQIISNCLSQGLPKLEEVHSKLFGKTAKVS